LQVVKSVVKPLIMRILRESRVPKKSVFTRAFGVFCFGIPWGRCPAPKPPALSTAPRPDVFNYTTNDLFLQVVKHVVKQLFTAILKGSIVPKKSMFTRLFSVFDFGKPWGRCPAPKQARYQLRYIPINSIFAIIL